MRIRSFITFSTLGLAFVACRGSSSNTVDSPSGSDAVSGAVTIQQVQNDQMAPGTPVTLSGVVVTAIDNFGGKVGDIWVEEPEGGMFSGIHIYKADPTVVATLAVGDIVNVSGAVKDEFALSGSNADPTGRTETELKPASTGGTVTVTKTGTGTVPPAADVNALMIGQLPDADMQGSAFSAAWEPWEGVLIKTTNVTALSAPKSFGSTMPTPPDNYSFGITGVAKVEGSLADIKSSGIARNTCLASVTGVVSYFYDYLVLPTSSADLATGGTACPALETACSDSVDNDGNGFNDCGDNNCIITAKSTGGNAACLMSTTISALDQAADANPAMPTLPAGGLEITGACVVKLSGTSNMYIAAAGLGANDGGLYAFGGGQALPTGVAEGSIVDVIGSASAFKQRSSTAPESQLEFNILQVTKQTGTCTPVAKPIANADAASLTMDANGHPLIGSYVTLTAPAAGHNFKVTTANSAMVNFGVFTQGTTTLAFGVGMVSTPPVLAANTCYDVLTGIWTYDTTGAGSYEILLTAAPSTATCR